MTLEVGVERTDEGSGVSLDPTEPTQAHISHLIPLDLG